MKKQVNKHYTSEIIFNILHNLGGIIHSETDINNTLEDQNVHIILKPNAINLKSEELQLVNYYNNYIGNWEDRSELEKNHYKFLTASIIHKIGEVQYFHKSENLTSRKFIVFSNDCIGAIQFLHRKDRDILNIFIRSSDALNLLPADLLFGCKLLKDIQKEFKLKGNELDEVNYLITSCHIYKKDKKKVEFILNNVEC